MIVAAGERLRRYQVSLPQSCRGVLAIDQRSQVAGGESVAGTHRLDHLHREGRDDRGGAIRVVLRSSMRVGLDHHPGTSTHHGAQPVRSVYPQSRRPLVRAQQQYIGRTHEREQGRGVPALPERRSPVEMILLFTSH